MSADATSTTTVAEVVEFLKDQHTRIKDLLPTVLQASGPERATAFATVRQTLAIHEAFEQVVIHPHARADAGDGVVKDRVEEEEEAGEAIASLESLDVNDDSFHDAYAAFMLDVVQHAEHEEHKEFDNISHEFSADERDAIDRGFKLARTERDAPAADLTFAEMLTNAKQAIAG
ncbi:MAG: hemerythrin [Marmoricola sp.]|nr:hemerythrin [Marmoricola sp.]